MPFRVATVLVVFALAGAACGDSNKPPPPPPSTAPTTTEPATTTTAEIVTVPGRPRPTTTLATEILGGQARIAGTVVGPSGPVTTATVRVERLVGTEVTTTDLTATNGAFNLPSIRGGHYRVRAWNRPDLVQLEPEVFFLAADETKTLELRMIKVADVSVETTIEPNPPPPNDVFTATVFVYAGSVNEEGILHAIPRTSLPVVLAVGSGLQLESPSTATTDAGGRASFRLRCVTAGPHPADLIVANLRISLGLPPCPG